MAISFTAEQQKVIELHNRNILVSAAAGSGKTAVLVERIIQMVCDGAKPVDIDRLLIVTFTNAAAAEMRERIADGIAKRLTENPESEHLQRQATLLHNALITTIDSFSLFMIRNHFNEIGLDPAFRVADEGEIKLLQQEVLKELLEEAYAEGAESFHECVEYFCPGGRETALEQHILKLSRYAASFPWPREWLMQRKTDYEAESVDTLVASDCYSYLKKYVRLMLKGCADKLREAKALCEMSDGPYMYGELIEAELEQLERLAAYGNGEYAGAAEADAALKSSAEEAEIWINYGTKIAAVSFGRLPSKKDDSVSPVKREQAKELRGQVKDILKELEEGMFATPMELALRQSKACAAPVCTLIDLVLEFNWRMQQKKQEKKLIDFSDMEHYALDILVHREGEEVTPSAVALEYRQYFHEILIDEYQDSNLVQEYLLKAISGEEDGSYNRFMVGDVKQSIYKFRLARPELFLEKYDTYAEEGVCQRIDLSKNFRSRQQVVDTVNDIFSRIMSREIGGIAYDENAALYAGAVYPESEGCTSELILVEKPQSDSDLSVKQAEAYAIARKIKALLRDFQVTDKETGGLRPVRFRDMVILLRSNSGWDEEFKEILEQEGIPVYITSKTGYFAAEEVQQLLQFLRTLDNPRQDIALFGVMKSVFGGFTEEEIAKIRSVQKDCSLYEAVCDYGKVSECADSTRTEQRCADTVGKTEAGEAVAGQEYSGRAEGVETAETDEETGYHDNKLAVKCRDFIRMIKQYRECTVYLPIRDLLQRLVDDFDYLSYVTALPAGSKRRANVEMLFTKASDFEKTSYFGLFHFIRYMEQLEKYDVDYGEADTLDENADVVRIMSIHKSKGLEFPVAFVAGLSKRFNMQDANQSLIVDMDLGLGVDYVDTKRRLRNKSLRRVVLSKKMREDNLAEELRVLYVALTRAKEKLILTAAMEKAEEVWERCRERNGSHLTYIDFMQASGYMDFLLPILGQCKIEVTVQEVSGILGEEVREQVDLYGRKLALFRAQDYVDEKAFAGLRARFTYEYPYGNLAELYTKTTVSELKIAAMSEKDEAAYHVFEEKEIVPYIPAFKRGEETVSGTVRGNAFHRAMELMDFEGLLGAQFPVFPERYEEYEKELDAAALSKKLHEYLITLTKQRRLPEEYLQALNERKLVRFLQTELAYRMWRADRAGGLYREQPFVLGIAANRLKPEFPLEENVLIQGIIDVFFVEDEKIVLLDYKTDVIDSLESLWKRYEVQLDYYGEALHRLMRLPVKERLLYSFYLEKYR